MVLKNEDMRKYEYILDVFKGTCELNNFEALRVPAYVDGKGYADIVAKVREEIPEDCEKAYFYGPVWDETEGVVLGAMRWNNSIYDVSEMINMAVKVLKNMDVEECTVVLWGENAPFVVENLEALDVVAKEEKGDLGKDKLRFSMYVDEEEVGRGALGENDLIYFSIDYEKLEENVSYKDAVGPLDVYVSPSCKEVLDDGFVIGAMLRDAGFKTEVDYSLEQATEDKVKATFLVTFDKEDIEKYRVKLVDMATREVKTVMLDNLIEEILYV